MIHRSRIFVLLFLLLGAPSPGFAQANPASIQPAVPAAAPGAAAATPGKPHSMAPAPESTIDKSQPFRRSFFFSAVDMLDISRALSGVQPEGLSSLGEASGKIPQVRTLSLQGIFYTSPSEWKIWLNGRKVTPWVQPKEIKEITVEPDVVHLKWFDIGANAVLKLDMRPNEVYDIVTGVSLPDQTQVKQETSKAGRR